MNADVRDSQSIPVRPSSTILHIYYLETRCEFLRVWRSPGFSVPTLLFPMMFYLFFGVLFANGPGGLQQATYTLAGLATFGVIGPGLFGFGVGFALDRGLGWLQVKRASPMPPSAYLLAKVAMSMLFAFLVVAILAIMAVTLSQVHLMTGQWVSLFLILVPGTVPFCALGLAIGAWAKPQGAPAIVNVIFLPMSFLSGLWLPLQFLPDYVRQFAVVLPAYHLGQLAFGAIGVQKDVPLLPHVLALVGFTVVFLAVALRGYRRNAMS